MFLIISIRDRPRNMQRILTRPLIVIEPQSIFSTSSGGPCFSCLIRLPVISTSLSCKLSWTIIRSRPMQFCPQFWNTPRIRIGTTALRSTSLFTIATSLPPSSSTHGVKFIEAAVATLAPTWGDPIKVMPSTPLLTTASPHSWNPTRN